MITRVIKEGPAGGKLKENQPEKFNIDGAKAVLSGALAQGFEIVSVSCGKLVISRYTGDEKDSFRNAEYQTFTGPIKELLVIAGAAKMATAA